MMDAVVDLPSLLAGPNIIYKCVYGSHAFGLATENSDTDIRGVFVLPKKQFYGLDRFEQISDERSNELYWELERFVYLLLKNNPNALEVLATRQELVLKKDSLFSELSIEIFLSGQCYETFAKYASTQLKKARGLNKKIVQPVDPRKKRILEFCYVLEGYGSKLLNDWLSEKNVNQKQCGLVRIPHMHDSYALFIGAEGEYGGIIKNEDSEDLQTSSVPIGNSPSAIVTFNRDSYRRSCRVYNEYWAWVKNRNEERYLTNIEAGKDFDTKNMMHVFRLIGMAEDIVQKKQIITLRPEREALLKIRRGERSYEDLVKEADDRLLKLKEEFQRSDLPPEPNRTVALEKLFQIRDMFYSREANSHQAS